MSKHDHLAVPSSHCILLSEYVYDSEDGSIHVRIYGSISTFEDPLRLYSDGKCVPSDDKINYILHNDPDADLSESGEQLHCSGCRKNMRARVLQPQELLRDWTSHKIQCTVLQYVNILLHLCFLSSD